MSMSTRPAARPLLLSLLLPVLALLLVAVACAAQEAPARRERRQFSWDQLGRQDDLDDLDLDLARPDRPGRPGRPDRPPPPPPPPPPPATDAPAPQPGDALVDGNGHPLNCPCPTSQEHNPVCGTNGATYNNPSKLRCAQRCNYEVELAYFGQCA